MRRGQRPTVYMLHGMKRSGNHAFTNWLLPQLHCAFANNALPLGPILRSGVWPRLLPFEEWRARCEGLDAASGSLLVTLEDHGLEVLPFVASGIELRRLLIVRDPKQLFSSRIRKASLVDMPAYPSTNDGVMQRAVAVWKEHARCFLGEDAFGYSGRIAVSFDAWFANRDYRAAISDALGVGFDDGGFGRVSAEGGGSSFDGTAFDGHGEAMGVADRVSRLDPRERGLLDALFEDDELRRLGSEIAIADPFCLLRID